MVFISFMNFIRNLSLFTEARWNIGMSSASHREDPGSNPSKGRFFRIKMNNVTFELLRCSYSHLFNLTHTFYDLFLLINMEPLTDK